MTEAERLRAGMERILEKRRLQSDTWRSDPRPQGHPGRSWHDGYTTAMAEVALIAMEAMDPEGWAEHEKQWKLGSHGTDREWFEATGNCGHCGNMAEDCLCSDADPCGCGPHPERRTWPRPCGWCRGTGEVAPVVRPG